MTAEEFEQRVAAWASGCPGVSALLQIGSRAQPDGKVDPWSDWDYHLVARGVAGFSRADWLERIAPVWCAHIEQTERGVRKWSVVFAGGFEADFVLVPTWHMKLALGAMRYPWAERYYPAALRRGIRNLRLIAAPGCQLVVGDEGWRGRLTALNAPWPVSAMSEQEFTSQVTGYWRHMVWVRKKAVRGENLAAQRWHVVHARENLWRLLEEDARLSGRKPRPEARYAEQWLNEQDLAALQQMEQGPVHTRLRAEAELFQRVAARVAKARDFTYNDHAELTRWMTIIAG